MADTSVKSIDPEAIKTYEQLKMKHMEARNAQRRVEEEIKELEIGNRRNQLMLVNLSQLEPETVTYKNVGKAYVLAPKSEIISSYEESYAAGLAALKKQKGDKEVVDKSVDSCLSELREHLEANQVLARAVLQQAQGA